jgi:hypothetical protein
MFARKGRSALVFIKRKRHSEGGDVMRYFFGSSLAVNICVVLL